MRKILSTLTILWLAGAASAGTLPGRMNYQGKLLDRTNNDNPYNGPVNLVFQIYDAASGGNTLWGPETHTGVTVTNGVFSVLLGEGTTPIALSTRAFTTANSWLGIKAGADAEMTPRQRLVMSPYAFTAAQVVNDDGAVLSAGVAYATFTAGGNFYVPYGIVTATGAFTSVTAASGTFTGSGSTQYSVQTSSGISMGAGTLVLANNSMGIQASGTGIVATTATFAVVTATGTGSYSLTTSSGIYLNGGTMVLDGKSRGILASGTGIVATTATFAVVTATGMGSYSVVTSSGINMGAGTLVLDPDSMGIRANGTGIVATTATFAVVTATGTGSYSLTTSSGIYLNGGTMVLDGKSRGILASGTGIVATTATFAVVTATGMGSYSVVTSSGINMGAGTLVLDPDSMGIRANGTGIVATTATFAVVTATGTGSYSVVASSGANFAAGTVNVAGFLKMGLYYRNYTANNANLRCACTTAGTQILGGGCFKVAVSVLQGYPSTENTDANAIGTQVADLATSARSWTCVFSGAVATNRCFAVCGRIAN